MKQSCVVDKPLEKPLIKKKNIRNNLSSLLKSWKSFLGNVSYLFWVNLYNGHTGSIPENL